jgi:hypothetical protein
MRKKLAALFVAGAIAGGVFMVSLAPAQATDPYLRLQRQINVLKGKVSSLQLQVNSLRNRVGDLEFDVYTCETYDSVTRVLYYDC